MHMELPKQAKFHGLGEAYKPILGYNKIEVSGSNDRSKTNDN